MKKIIFLGIVIFISGCSNFKINSTMCDQIMSEPNSQNIPTECRNYNEKEADKAFFKDKEDKKADVEDIIEFEKEESK